MTSTKVDGRILTYVLIYGALHCDESANIGFGNVPYYVALEKDSRHDALIHLVDLADLRKLKSARGSGQEEANNDENRVVQNADRHILGKDGQDRGHDEGRQNHTAQQRGDEKLRSNLVLLGVSHLLALLSVASEVGSENDQNQGHSDSGTRLNGVGKTVLDE